MPKLHLQNFGVWGVKLRAENGEYEDAGDLPWNEAVEDEFYEVGAVLNRKGEVMSFEISLPMGPDIMEDIIRYVKQNPPPGLYTVPELGLKDVPFDVVLEKVKEYYEKKHY